MAKVRLIDIAKKAGVSASTVSLILNNKAEKLRISPDLIAKVQKVAHSVGYVPNQVAVSLRTGKTKVICLIVEDFANPFFAGITSLIEARLREKGYQLVCSSIANDPVNTTTLIKKLSNGLVDGFFITPMPGLENDIRMLVKTGIPVVLVDSTYHGLAIPCVLTDNIQGVTMGMEHLMKNLYKKILFVSVDYDAIQIRQREQAYEQVMIKNGLTPKIVSLEYSTIKNINREELCNEIAAYHPDAVFFATNYLGIEGLECIDSLSLKIPDDIAVICFDDHDAFRLYKPSITVVEQSIEQIVSASMNIMFDLLNAHLKQQAEAQLIRSNLIIRKSTKRKD